MDAPFARCQSCGAGIAAQEGAMFCPRCGAALEPGAPTPGGSADSGNNANAGTPDADTSHPATLAGPASRTHGVDRRIIFGAVAAMVGIAVLVAAIISLQPKSIDKLQDAVRAIAARTAPATLTDAGTAAEALGITAAPADVSFAIVDWKDATPKTGAEPGGVVGVFTLVASRAGGEVGRSPVTIEAVTIEKPAKDGPELALVGIHGAGIPLAALAPKVGSLDEAQAAADAANTANAAFSESAGVSIDSSRAPDGTVPYPPDVEQPSSSLLTTDRVLLNAAVSAERTTWTWVTPAGVIEIGSAITKQPTAAVYQVGTVDPASIIGPASRALATFEQAAQSGDVAAAKAVLIHAQGVTAAGLKEADLGDASALTAVKDGDHFAARTASGALIAQDSSGAWKIDYTGQPLGALRPVGSVGYDGVDTNGASPISVSLVAATPASGGSFAPQFRIDITAGGRMPYSDELWITSLFVNGVQQDIPGGKTVDACHVGGEQSLTCGWPTDVLPLHYPTEGIESMVVGLRFGSSWNETIYFSGQVGLALDGSDVWQSKGSISADFPNGYGGYGGKSAMHAGLVVVAPGQQEFVVPMTWTTAPYGDVTGSVRMTVTVNGEDLATESANVDEVRGHDGLTFSASKEAIPVPDGGVQTLEVKVEFISGGMVLASRILTFER